MSTRAGAAPAAATPPERRAGPPTRAQQVEAGAAARRQLGRRSLGAYAPAADRPDPVSIIAAQDANRVPELVPIRNGRMLASPFAFYRGAAAIMAADLGAAPHSGLKVQLCGDAHLSNFGVFASPERTLVFDLSDFDETLPGPFEWDVKRLLASFVIAGRSFAWRKGLGPDHWAVRRHERHQQDVRLDRRHRPHPQARARAVESAQAAGDHAERRARARRW